MKDGVKLKWIQACSLGWFISILVILALSAMLDGLGIESLQFYLGVGMGAGVGFMQWRRLKLTAGMGAKWIWYSIAGLGTPFLLFDIIRELTDWLPGIGSDYIAYIVPVAGLFAGILQYRVLKRISRKAVAWIPASFGGWILAVLTVLSLDYTGRISSNNIVQFFMNLFLILAGGLVLGLVTNPVIKRILANRKNS